MINLGTVRPGSTILVPFNAFDSNDPSASVIVSDFILADIGIYKGTSMTERASTSGVVLLDTDGINIDGATGVHGFSIDLADNGTAGFYSAGSHYYVTVGPITIDAATVNFVAATFTIGYPDAIINTTIASVTNQAQFILTVGPAEADVLIGCPVLLHDVASAVQVSVGYITDYIVTTKEVFLAADPGGFTFVATDNVSIFMPSNVRAVGGTLQTAGDLKADLNTLLGRITSGLFAGITSLADWLGAMAAKHTADATAITEIKATGAGSGTYDATTDSGEAIRDTAPMGTAMRGTDSAALATLFTGITSVAEWLGLLAGKQTGNATARTEIRATGAGSGTYDETADSGEAIRDRGDAEWITGNTTTPPTAAAIVNEWETQSQADPTGFHVNLKEVNGTAQTAGDIPALVTTVDGVVDGIATTLNGLVLAQGTIGATGNDTIHLHLDGLAYGDDEVNDHLIALLDVSTGLYYSTWISDFATATDLATVNTLPITPEASVDLYWLLPMRQDAVAAALIDIQTQIGTAGDGLTDLGGMSTEMKAEIVVEVDNALNAAISELGVAAPTATPTIRTGLMLLYMALRNKTVVQTSGTDALEIYNNAGTKIAAKLLADDGSDYTEAQMS